MGQQIIHHTCGHTSTVALFGKHSERDRKAAYLASCDCRDCERKAAAEKANEDGLCELKGSEKQINWALSIRAKKIAEFKDHCERLIKLAPQGEEKIRNALNKAAKIESSSWWIDRRFDSANQMTKAVVSK